MPRWTTLATLAVCTLAALLIVGSRAVGLLSRPDPWVDEAMLALNFLRGSWAGLLQPQPYFEQATSLGHLVVGRLAASVAPDHIAIILRYVSALVSIAAALAMFFTFKKARPPVEAALMAAFAMCAPSVIFQSIEMKPYIIDLLSTAVVMLAALHTELRLQSPRSLAVFVGAGLAALVFSNAAVFAIVAVGGAMVISALGERPYSLGRLARIAVAGAVLGMGAAAVYLAYTRNATAFQLHAYAKAFSVGKLPMPVLQHGWIGPWIQFARLLREPFLHEPAGIVSPGAVFYGLELTGMASTLFSRSSAARFLAIAGILFLALVALAGIAGIYTPFADRHLLFTVPVTAFFVVAGLASIVSVTTQAAPARFRAGAATGALAALVLAYCGYQVVRESDGTRAPLKPAIERLIALKAWPDKVWVYYAAQPEVDFLTYPQSAAYLGRVSHRTSPIGWLWEVRLHYGAYVERMRRDLTGRDEIYLITSDVHANEEAPLLATARRTIGPCRELFHGHGNRDSTELYHCARAERP